MKTFDFISALALFSVLSGCVSTRGTHDEIHQTSEVKRYTPITLSRNFTKALTDTGQSANKFCFNLVEKNKKTFVFVQESPCGVDNKNGVFININSLAPSESLYLDSVEIGKLSSRQIEIESLCTGFYQNTCSLATSVGKDAPVVALKAITDQGLVQNQTNKAVFRYQIQNKGNQYQIFFSYESLDDLSAFAICNLSEKKPSPDFFRSYLKSAKVDQSLLPPSVVVEKSKGLTSKGSSSTIVIDTLGKLKSIACKGQKFIIIPYADGASISVDSLAFCPNVGMKPADLRNMFGGMPVYGNWCGPGYGGDIENIPPAIDEVDRSCMHHDLCYKNHGMLNCNCDGALLRNLAVVSANGPEAERARAEILSYFATAPCICEKNVCIGGICKKIKVNSCCGICPG